MKSKAKFPCAAAGPFYSELRKRVNNHIKENQISPNANFSMWLKTCIFLAAYLCLYVGILLIPLNLLSLTALTILLGMTAAFVGFNVCHDAIHGSFSKSKGVNRSLSFLFNFLGANPYVWNITHNVVHHTYTNIAGHDEDIEVAPGLIRISESDELKGFHRYQQWYAFPLYGIASLSWVFRKDYKKFFQIAVGSHTNKHPKIEYFNLFFYKALYYFLFLAVPMLIMEIQWYQVIIGFLILHLAQGFTMGLVFQLAHVVEGTDFPLPDEGGNMQEAWAEHQMNTTANFATNCKFSAFFLGGLNRQIEHHLFPKICHIHYGWISKIVKTTALEHGIVYNENKTFTLALRSHFNMLKKMGRI